MDKKNIMKKLLQRNLTIRKKKWSGRNNTGKITVRGIGGGHKQKYRIIDYKGSAGIWKVVEFHYDPNRTANIVLLEKQIDFNIIEKSQLTDINTSTNHISQNSISGLNQINKDFDASNHSQLENVVGNGKINQVEIIPLVKKKYILQLAEKSMKKNDLIINLNNITDIKLVEEILKNPILKNIKITLNGSFIPLKFLPLSTNIYNLQDKLNKNPKYLRSAGMTGTIVKLNFYDKTSS